MLKTPTVFVLGAGAHFPYGMPTGKDLMSKIIDMLPTPGKSSPVAGRMHHLIGTFYSTYGTGAADIAVNYQSGEDQCGEVRNVTGGGCQRTGRSSIPGGVAALR